jgi:hypothetical protein
MDFSLPDTATDLCRELRKWRTSGNQELPSENLFDESRWREFLDWDLFDDESVDHLHRTCGLMEVARSGLPGPVLEAYLALIADPSGDVRRRLREGQVVTSLQTTGRRSNLVGWGAVSAIVVDQSVGTILAEGPLPRVGLSYPVPHGWLELQPRTVAHPPVSTAIEVRRRLATAALCCGLIEGALEMTVGHVKVRKQFGRALAEFQAIQFPLAELSVFAQGLRLSVIDAAVRLDSGDPRAGTAACLALVSAATVSLKAINTCHQAFGASGFCDETGLTALTWSLSWLTEPSQIKAARRVLTDQRLAARRTRSDADFPCLIMEGFGDEALAFESEGARVGQ